MKMDYDFKSKNDWRRWAWNRLRDLSPVHPSEARVLYLATGEDLDRGVAVAKGFRSDNLIGITRDGGAVKRIRAARGWAVEGDLQMVLGCWPDDWPVHGVLADLTSGLSHDAGDLSMILVAGGGLPSPRAVVVNLLRGRDAVSNAFRSDLATCMSQDGVPLAPDMPPEGLKNRAVGFLLMYLSDFGQALRHFGEAVDLGLADRISNTKRHWASYRSTAGHQRFDSLAFTCYGLNCGVVHDAARSHVTARYYERHERQVRGRITALRAWQTRRAR